MKIVDVDDLSTEQFGHDEGLDAMDTTEILQRMNRSDRSVPDAVAGAIPDVARAVDSIAERMARGGRLIYIGAGSSGRLGVLDAAECPPTFGISSDLVVGVIAGGDSAIRHAVENAEDSLEQGEGDIKELRVTERDTVVGISASGRTPYVMGALNYAKSCGALTVAISNNVNSKIGILSDIAIDVETGPEVLAGSTRLKAGTAQKLVLNMISTAVMVRLGKVYRNLMVDMRPTNQKLERRARRIIAAACQCSDENADALFRAASGNIKAAIVMGILKIQYEEAVQRLYQAGGYVRAAVKGIWEDGVQ